MSKERELLRKILEAPNNGGRFYLGNILIKNIKELLAEPEPEPLSDEKLSILATDDLYDCTHTTSVFAYKEYARKIERAHGIRGRNE